MKLTDQQMALLKKHNVNLEVALQGNDFVSQGTNAVRIIQILEVALADGFTLDDLLQLLAIEPLFQQIRRNISKALNSLRNIPVDDRAAVGVAIYNNSLSFANLGPVSWWVVQALAVGGFVWEKVSEGAETFQQLRRVMDAFISREDTVPIILELDED